MCLWKWFFLCKIGPLNVVPPYPWGLWIWQIWIFTIWNCFHTRFSFSAQLFLNLFVYFFYRFFSTHPFVKTRSANEIHPIPGYYDLNKLSDDTLRNKLQFFWATVFEKMICIFLSKNSIRPHYDHCDLSVLPGILIWTNSYRSTLPDDVSTQVLAL